VKGAIKAAASLALLFGYGTVVGDINTLREQVPQVILQAAALYGSCEMIFGLARKIYIGIVG
jgi:hypothetical protein